ncbi:MAG TPA: DUF4382 domain-containing protein [Candidatus Binataceae bacterium]|nr:DUF4382 domain-containing protein [Candidatus Binataceae bacterium]
MAIISKKSQIGPNIFAIALSGCALIFAAGPALASGSVAVHLSNRNTPGRACKANDITHIYVTVADVKAHQAGHGGFQSLIGNATPAQFDLMFAGNESTEAIGSADCPIVGLGGTGLAPGRYQQIRLITAANGTTGVIKPGDNACVTLGSLDPTVYNCVEAGGTFYPLTIPSGSNTGLKIPPGRVGHLKIVDGQSVDLDIDVNPCNSLVAHGGARSQNRGKHKGKGGGGNGSYLMKPTLQGSAISLNPVISGQVVTGTATGAGTTVTAGTTAVPGASVWLEEDAAQSVGVGDPAYDSGQTAVPANTVVASATTDSNGNFALCPVPMGNYDIVVDAESVPNATNPSDATVTTGVTVTANSGVGAITIPLIEGSAAAVTLAPQVTTGNTSATGDDIDFFGTQGFGSATPVNQAIIPPYSGTSLEPQTTSSAGTGCTTTPICPVGTNCVCFDVAMPSDNPVTGAVGGPYTSGSGTANYSLLGNANVIGTSTPACSPSQLISLPAASPLALPTLSFTGCD